MPSVSPIRPSIKSPPLATVHGELQELFAAAACISEGRAALVLAKTAQAYGRRIDEFQKVWGYAARAEELLKAIDSTSPAMRRRCAEQMRALDDLFGDATAAALRMSWPPADTNVVDLSAARARLRGAS